MLAAGRAKVELAPVGADDLDRLAGLGDVDEVFQIPRASVQPFDLGPFGEVFLVVDNWGAFTRELPELEAGIGELAATGLHYGVHLVLAANRWADLRPGLRDNLGGRLELRLNDPLESELGRVAAATDRKSTRLNSSHATLSRMPSSA